ncbi:MAG: selenocysteine-specific translation elongation factor [Bacteroidales bacterium]|jgi:selenocysteine-specific elongation factor|nr:selenocysteine-specific translation elongation factor [Bacteroidales bacterium]
MKHIIIGTAGHIDHGKTSLIRLLTGTDCDTHIEEKQRGITINLGFTHLDLPGGDSVGIIDVPGHKDFINTMIGGACGIDMVLLVIAADSGIMPQTVEHINIITALGIGRGVVALTKTDLVDEELVEMARYEISEFLKNSALRNAPVIGVSSHTGQGKEDLLSAIETLMTEIEDKEPGSLFRMYIDRLFSVKGFGSVVTGSVLGGCLKAGEDVFLLPGDRKKLRIRSLERHGKQVDRVTRGDRAAINLIGLGKEDFERGQLISNRQIEGTIMADAYISLFNDVPALSLWSNVTFITGTFECQARIHLLNRDSMPAGSDAIVQIHLGRKAVLVNRDRFVLRNSSADRTLGGGYIIDSSPLHHRKRTPQLIETLSSLCVNMLTESSLAENVAMLLRREFRPMTIDEVAERLNLSGDDVKAAFQDNRDDFIVYPNDGGEIIISEKCEKNYMAGILRSLQEFHDKNPLLDKGLETGDIAGKLGLSDIKAGKTYLQLILEKMAGDNLIGRVRNTWTIYGHRPQLDARTLEHLKWLEDDIIGYGEGKPVVEEIEERALARGINRADLSQYISFLGNAGKLKFCGSDFLHVSIADKYRIVLLKSLTSAEKGLSIPEFKELIPGTKRFRALLGEILEKEKLIRYDLQSECESRITITAKGREWIERYQGT